jgi:hypothetical protein
MHGLRKHFLVPLVYILNTITQVTADMIKPTVYHTFPPVVLQEWFCDMKLVQVKGNSSCRGSQLTLDINIPCKPGLVITSQSEQKDECEQQFDI